MDYQPLIDRWRDTELDRWAQRLPQQLAQGLSHQRYGDLARWLAVLDSLPDIAPDYCTLDRPRVGAGGHQPLPPHTRAALEQSLMGLHPWRKGPFELFGVHIDTEWRSDWKWQRLQAGIAPLSGRRVLDVGCGSGYHCWRMLGAGAAEVIGIDPTPLFVVQFWALQKYLQRPEAWVIPAGIEQVPAKLQAFDTVFSMGVLYHRRSPMDHLLELRDCLRPGGQLVLETLVIEGGVGATLVPEGRYARMGNVWFLPSCDTLLGWLRKTGFERPRVLDVATTTPDEQRATPWMTFHSLANFLDPANPSRTVEGYPAPRRAVIAAEAAGSWQPRVP
ncbi:tRNA 5-methoxyuridine(34)/uridine 5-oxyacetic acid(34) synthase CmoB [Seongchinamella sediminis]|uniref:tRNA U34 carboxymethyltransferase n=1 Tax=Seongchinamella sediminis TaxID=2283635 RepID=A0A3L7DWM6_9GAMM|nr:tRNA 5-methoxyuridine(34)/uridine 5-oxyacetic acid(34) synthase CmoB [Seongchinamella sediminis]RLQ20969.1 tRNA 5-methoxyuridine(34)/uridine 5-oxyacetic acid(34) synthase CmoB [Seongchinamella sediminis]